MIQCYRVRDENEARDIAAEAEAHSKGNGLNCPTTLLLLVLSGVALVGLPLWAVLA